MVGFGSVGGMHVRGGSEREGDRIPSRLRAARAEPETGLELMKLRDRDLSRNQESDA